MPIADRIDPYQSFRFLIEIQGLIVAGFSEVSGLQAETEVEDVKEGGVNDHIHRLAKISRYPNLVLKRGIADNDALWKWHQDVIEGKVERRDVYVVLLSSDGDEKWRWHFSGAYPVKWNGPEMKADANAIAMESVELAHNGIKKA